jgi:3-ketosteroid 9alpha-monooxygenase subunit B
MTDHEQVVRHHRYNALTVAAVVDETHDTKTFVLEIPTSLGNLYEYRAGQFCAIRATVDGDELVRCYSMSTAPAADKAFAFTVKRVPGGLMSNWLHDHVQVGDTVDLMPPAGTFCVRPSAGPIVAFCGGSGVTPILSIVKEVLATTGQPVHVLYANRDHSSIIFRAELDLLAATNPGRLHVRHHLDDQAGFLNENDIVEFVTGMADGAFYVCGPTPFMDVVETGLAQAGMGTSNIAIERFIAGRDPAAPADPGAPDHDSTSDDEGTKTVTIVLKGKRNTVDYVAGDTVLDTARRGGLKPPFSCEMGSCASCMALVHEGSATMRANSALSADEVSAGWVLTCQAVPVGREVVVEYENL